MKRSFLCLSLGLVAAFLVSGILLSPSRALAEDPPVVAIFLMESRGSSLKADEVVSLTDYLAARLGEGGKFQIIPRDELKKRLKAAKANSHKECIDTSCQIELGREMAAQFSISTGIARVGRLCLMTASVWDLRKATQIKGATRKSACKADELIEAVDAIADKIERAMTGESTPRPAPVAAAIKPTNTPVVAAPAPVVAAPAPARVVQPVAAGGIQRSTMLLLAKANFNSNEEVELKWYGSNGSSYDWVDVVPEGTPDDSAGAYLKYLDGKAGTYRLSGLDDGLYHARIYQDYNTKGYRVADRLSFRMGPPPADARTLPVASRMVGLTKAVYSSSEPIEVHWFGTNGSRYDWVDVLAKGEADNMTSDHLHYLKSKDGSFRIDKLDPGSYEVRIYQNYNTVGYKVADRLSFQVR